MKLLCSLFILFCFTQLKAQSDYSDSLRKVRIEHDSVFLKTVLNDAERGNMLSLCYFKPDTKYIVKAEFTRIKGKKFEMPMTRTRNKTVYYRKYGKLTFSLNDTVCELFLYENLNLKGNKEFKDYLFLPFRDMTSGELSYGGGRFIDIHKPADNNWVIDFNTNYNPYCAYSERYSCPVTPTENTLKVAVYSGTCYSGHD